MMQKNFFTHLALDEGQIQTKNWGFVAKSLSQKSKP